MLQTNGSGVLSWQSVQGVPTGSIFCIAHSTIPGGYLECNGAQHLISVHGALSNVLGTTWNNPAPDSGYFRVPDLRGEFIRGADNGRNVDMVSGSSRSPFSWQGDLTKTHTHTYSATTNQQGDHNHWVMYNLGQNQGGLRDHAGDPYAATAASYGTGNDPRQDAEIGARSGTAANAGQSSAAGAHSHTISGTTSSHDSSAGETRPRNVSMIYIIKT
jgi:microcystin-dependent protein